MVKAGRLMFLAQSYCTPLETEVDGVKGLTLLPQMPSCKVDALVDDIYSEDYGDSSLVMFFESRKLLDLAREQIQKKMGEGWDEITEIVGGMDDWDTDKAISDFQSGKKKIILLTYGAAREGITLTAADTMLLVQRSWSQLAMEQAMGRIHRPGAEKHASISIVDYVTAGTIEQTQLERNITDHEMLQELVQDAARMEAFLRS
jgi:superfamily II DNA or RNA helicase